MLLLYYYALWGIHGVFTEYSRGIHMYRVCIGYVSGMYRECVETYGVQKRFLFKFRARKINFQQQKQQKINNYCARQHALAMLVGGRDLMSRTKVSENCYVSTTEGHLSAGIY